MAEYELVHEIKNMCRNNQMRDVFFSEVECDDPEEYVLRQLKGKLWRPPGKMARRGR